VTDQSVSLQKFGCRFGRIAAALVILLVAVVVGAPVAAVAQVGKSPAAVVVGAPAAAVAHVGKSPPPPGAAPNANCSGNGCNGKDPEASGCSANAVTLASAAMLTVNRDNIGTIEMRYSRNCGTQWIRVNSRVTDCAGDPCQNDAVITRPAGADGPAITVEDAGRPASGQPSQWTRMVYTPDVRSCGTGAADTGNFVAFPRGVRGTQICG
jgi:hypothetical protein